MAKQENKGADTIVDVQQVYTKTEMFLENNRKPMMMGLGAIVLVVGGFFAYQYLYKKPKETEAANAIYMADLYSGMDSLEWAVMGHDGSMGYEEIAQNFKGTLVGKRANYWCGVYQRDIKLDYNKALEYFKESDFDDNSVGVMATGSVGDMYIQLGNNEEGASWLEKAAKQANNSESRDFTGPMYGLKAAKAYLELGDNKKAASLLEYVLDNYDKKQTEGMEAAKLLAYIKAKG
jgi:FimV-like protein